MKFIQSTENECWQEGNEVYENKFDEIFEGEKMQQIDGFGGCFNELGMIAAKELSTEKQEEVFNSLFGEDGCNFNYNRMSIGANDFSESWYSYNENDGDFEMEKFSIERDNKYVIPFIREAQKRQKDMTLFASPWSPPTWLKFPKAYNFGKLIWEEKYLKSYAKYIRLFIEAYKKKNIKISQYHIQNEPCSSQKFPSCVWTGEEYRDFISDYLSEEFENNNIETEVWVGTINGPESDGRYAFTRFNNFANTIMENEKCRETVKGFAYQWAGKFAVQQTHDAFPDKKIIQSESECGDSENTWAYAMYIFEMIKHYFRNGANAYVYWNMILKDGGLSTWGWTQNSLITIKDKKAIYNPEFFLMKHLSHFVKKGARLLSVSGAWSSNTILFSNPDESKVAVIMNPFEKDKTVKVFDKCFNLKPRSFNTIII